MNASTTPARMVALLFLLQGAIAPVANFRLLAPAISATPGFLQNAAARAGDVRLATLLLFVASACTVAIGVVLVTQWRVRGRAAALGFLALGSVGLAVTVCEAAALHAMVAVSRDFVARGGQATADYESLRVTLRALRHTAHYSGLLLAGLGLLLLHASLFATRRVPRVLAAAGAGAAALLVVAACAPLLGGRIVMSLLLPIGLCQLALVAWLVWRGFAPDATDGGTQA